MTIARRLSLPIVFLPILLSFGCKQEAVRSVEIERLQAKVAADREMLIRDAETADPSRTDLKVTFVDSSIMDIRPTNNEQRPYVGHVRIRWSFAHTDGRPIGDAVWDYVYALTAERQWIKADDAPVPVTTPPRAVDDATPEVTPAAGGTAVKPA